MTYQEILQAEKFIEEIIALQNRAIKGELIWEDIAHLDDRINSSFEKYSPVGIDWQYILYGDHDDCDCIELVPTLDTMQCALQALLNQEPMYGTIKLIQDDINRCKKCPFKGKRDLIGELVAKHSIEIKFDKTVYAYLSSENEFVLIDRTEEIFNGVVGCLSLYLEKLTMPQRTTQSKERAAQVQVFNNQTNTQNVAINIDISIENCLKSLDDCETLATEEIVDIKKQLADVQEMLANKRGKKKTIREKIGAMLKWVANKGTDVMIALLPTLINILQSL